MSECREGQEHFEFSMSPDVTDQLQRMSDAHAEAMDLFEQGDYVEAEVALGEALVQESRDIAQARIFLDLALCIWTPYVYARDFEFAWGQDSFAKALAYLDRAEVLFRSDQHRLVTDEDIQTLKNLRKKISTKIIAPSHDVQPANLEDQVENELVQPTDITVTRELGHIGIAQKGFATPEFSSAA